MFYRQKKFTLKIYHLTRCISSFIALVHSSLEIDLLTWKKTTMGPKCWRSLVLVYILVSVCTPNCSQVIYTKLEMNLIHLLNFSKVDFFFFSYDIFITETHKHGECHLKKCLAILVFIDHETILTRSPFYYSCDIHPLKPGFCLVVSMKK